MTRARRAALLAVVLAAAGAVYGGTRLVGSDPALPTPRGAATASATRPGAATPAATVERPHPVSIQALIRKRYDGRDLRLGSVLARNQAYTRYAVTYRSGRLTISGVMNVPRGNGPFPVLILNHGYIDPAVYTSGRGLRREQDYLARRGYAVFHVDYRNHAGSDDEPGYETNLRLGYVEDAINAVMAVRRSSLGFLDGDRVGMVGRSMGGGVTLGAAVVRPELLDAVVVFASVSSDYVHNFNRWIRRSGERRRIAQRIIARYGSPERNPEFWRNVSPRTFFGRITMPVLMHHGTSDDTTPIAWSRETLAALRRHGKQARLHVYEGEEHAFGPQWPASMRRTVAFLDRHVKHG